MYGLSAATRAALLTAATLSAACRNGASTEKGEATRAEAGRVAHQVKVLRDADNAEKPVLLKALDQLPCAAPDVCSVKKTCSEAYTLQETALTALSTVRHSVQGLVPGTDKEEALLLSEAEAAHSRAKDLAAKCADAEAALRRQYRL